MEKIDENLFYVKLLFFVEDLRKNIFKCQFFVNEEIDMIIYFDKDINEFWIWKTTDIDEKNIMKIYTIKDWYFRDNENVDFWKLYEKVYIKLVSNSMDEIKEFLSSEIYLTDAEYKIFYEKLLEVMKKDYWNDWLSFYLLIQDLIDENQSFRNYFNLIRVKEYIKQKIDGNDLKYIEDIIHNFGYENIVYK